MQIWRQKTEIPEVSRADVILARKGAPRRPGARNLLEISIPRRVQRQTHQRHEDRSLLAGVSAEIRIGRKRFSAPVANVSSNGMMIVSDRSFSIGDEVTAAIDRCDPIPMIVRWLRGGRVGLEFLAETTIVAQAGVQHFIIDTIHREGEVNSAHFAPTAGAENRNDSQRHALVWMCELSAGGRVMAARLRNISRGGALVSFDDGDLPEAGEHVVLAMGENSRFAASVRWVAEGLAGLRFAEPFPLEDLVDQPCAAIVAEDETSAESQDEAPVAEYEALTLRQLYATLHN